MNHLLTKTIAAAGLVAAFGSAHAGCFNDAFNQLPKMEKQSWHGGAARLMNVDWRHHDDDIVGFWNFTVIGQGNGTLQFDGKVVDQGLQQYHDDGTEMSNASTQNPATQNYCLGTWEQTGPYAYKLNHFAYLYDGTPANKVNGLVRVRQNVVLSRDGNEINGTEITELYTLDRNLMLTIKGVLSGKRITTATTAQQVM